MQGKSGRVGAGISTEGAQEMQKEAVLSAQYSVLRTRTRAQGPRTDWRVMRSLACGFIFFFLGSAALGQMPGKTIALHCGSLFDGRGDSLRKNVVVVIEGEKIKEISGNAPIGA